MKQKLLKTMLLLCALVVGGASSVWATDYELAYTLTPASGTNNNYASNCDIVINSITWNLSGNSQVQPWRLGASKANTLSGENRVLYSKTAISDNISKIEIIQGADAYITVNSMTVSVHSSADDAASGSNAVATFTPEYTASSTITITKADESNWAGKFYRIVYNLTKTNTKNAGYVSISEAKLYIEASTSDPSSEVTFDVKEPSITYPATKTYSQEPSTAVGYSGTITYSLITNTAGATIDSESGLVTVTQGGSVTVKARAAAVDGYFSSSEDTYTLTVTDTRTSAGLAWSAASADVTFGEDNVYPTLTNTHSVPVTYSSSYTAAATIDGNGVITLKDINANTTISAIFAGNDDYLPQTVTYTLNVTEGPFVLEDGVFNFVKAANQAPLEDYGSGVALTNSEYTTGSKTWTAGNVTMVTSDGGGNGIRWWSADGTLRFYNKATATFSVPSGYVITKIVTSGANFNAATAGSLSGATWTGASNSVQLSVDNTRNIKTITVTYTTENQSVTLNSSGYATYASPYALDFSGVSGFSAWQISAANSSTGVITFSQITGAVAVGTGVLLKGTPSASINIPVAASGTNISDTNKLVGITTPTDVDADTYYGLSGSSFVKVNAGTVPAGKALLPVSEVSSGVKAFKFVFEGEDDADGINAVNGEGFKVNGSIYNLAGQRINKLQKGINIVNGKKVLF